MCIRLLVAGCLCWFAIAAGQTTAGAKIHDFTDAYQIYSLLLPHEESYGFAKGTLVIQEEMVSERAVSEPCVTPEAARRFKDAIADYRHVNSQRGMLKRQFQIERSYEVVSSDTIKALFKDGGWDSFYKRYPESGGYIIMSAVGFNKERTRAVVYTGSSCGDLCGNGPALGVSESFCLRSVMNFSRALYAESLVLLVVIAGCGSSGMNLNNVMVTVSPAAVTIPPSGEVTLQATVTGSPGAPFVSSWTIAELKMNGASGAQCNWSGTTPPAGPCPDGTISGEDIPPGSVTVTYHAPSTSGTFHVIAEWSTAFNPVIIKDGTSVITVGP